MHVQKLNGIRGDIDEASSSYKEESDEDCDKTQEITLNVEKQRPNKSKWSDFVDKEEIPQVNNEETLYIDDKEVVLEVPKKRIKKLGRNFKNPAKSEKTNGHEKTCFSEIKTSNSPRKLSAVYGNVPLNDSMNIPFSNQMRLETTQKTNEEIIPNEIQTRCKNVEFQSNTIHKENLFAKTFLPPAVKSNSKWAQFVDNDDQTEEVAGDELEPQNHDHNPCSDLQTLFSLCDDNDLDDVLNI